MILDPQRLRSLVRAAITSGERQELEPYAPVGDDDVHEYLMFLKPELSTLEGPALDKALSIVQEMMARFEQAIVAGAVLPGRYLERHDLMARHYSVINAASRLGLSVVSDAGHEVLRSLLEADVLDSSAVFGGHEFLSEFQYFSPEALSVLHDSGEGTKVDPSVYAIRAVIDGEAIAILNGFHPFQLAWFYRLNSAITALVVRSDIPWKELRQGMTGSTIPARASKDTIRGRLLDAREEIGVSVSPLKNGVHLSAGPVEAAVEIGRYMSDYDEDRLVRLSDTTFGRVATARLGTERFEDLAKNPIVSYLGQPVSVFDLTEERDSLEALDLLSQLNGREANGARG